MNKEYVILTSLASGILFGYGYGLDIPAALQKPLRQEPYNFDNIKFNLLYFFTFLPVALFLVPIGILIDKLPLRVSMYSLLTISFLSQLTFSLCFETLFDNYEWVVYISRSFFGAVGQGCFVIQAVIIASCAKENYEVIMGICLSLPFIMDALNSFVTTHVFDATQNMALPCYIGTFVCLISLLLAIFVDKLYMKQIERDQQEKKEKTFLEEPLSSKDIQQKLILHKIESKQEKKEQEGFKLSTLKQFSSQFWVIIAAIFFFQSCLGPFNDNMNDLLVKRFNFSYTDSGKLLLIPFALLAFFAYFISRVCFLKPKWRRKILLGISTAFFLTNLLVYLMPNTKDPTWIYYCVVAFYMIMIGLSFANYYSIVTSSISYLVPAQYLGTAFGICGMALGLCQCLVPLVNSAILDQYSDLARSYEELSLFGAGLSFFPLLFSLWISQKEFQALDHNLIDDFVSSASMFGTQNYSNADDLQDLDDIDTEDPIQEEI